MNAELEDQIKTLIGNQVEIKEFLQKEHSNLKKLPLDQRTASKAVKVYTKLKPFYKDLITNNDVLNSLLTTEEEKQVIKELFEIAQVDFCQIISILNAMNAEIPLVSLRKDDPIDPPEKTTNEDVNETFTENNDEKLIVIDPIDDDNAYGLPNPFPTVSE